MKDRVASILSQAGITINGDKPYDIKIHSKKVYDAVLTKQSIGAGETYMDGLWDCDALDEFFFRICRHKIYDQFTVKWFDLYRNLMNTLVNQQSPQKSLDVANHHYNLGNTLYECMLGKSMAYTCGYWKKAQSLDEAQFAKYALVCKKLMLCPGETVLEIGCGWGGLAKYMAEQHGVSVVAMDIGREPARYAKILCKDLSVQIYECDYRDVKKYNPTHKKFDKIVSVGVLEHVGYKNYACLISLMQQFIKEEGIILLHSIGGNTTKKYCEPWIDKYIFPHGMLPSLKQLGQAFENKVIVEDHHNFGAYYDKTLRSWYDNFNLHWPLLKRQYDERFRRMMNYYLLSCAGGFRARDMQLWQFVLTSNGKLGGYKRFC